MRKLLTLLSILLLALLIISCRSENETATTDEIAEVTGVSAAPQGGWTAEIPFGEPYRVGTDWGTDGINWSFVFELENGINSDELSANYLLQDKINYEDINAIQVISEMPGEDFFALREITDREEIAEIVSVLNHATIGARHEPYDGGSSSVLFLNNDSVIHEFNFGASGFGSVFLNDSRRWMYCIQFSGTPLSELIKSSTAEREHIYR